MKLSLRTFLVGAALAGSLTASAAVNYSFNADTLWDSTSMTFKTVESFATGGQANTNVLGGANTTDFTKLIQTFQVTGAGYTVTDLYILTDDYAANAVINFRIVALGDAVTKTASGYYPAAGTVLWTGSFSQSSANSNNQLFRIQLTGADQFTLAANSGNAGYGLEISTSVSAQSIDWGRANTGSSIYAAYRETYAGTDTIVDTSRPLYFGFSGTSNIPEPSTYAALLGLGTLGLCLYRRKR